MIRFPWRAKARAHRFRRDETGASTVEFVLIFPAFLALFNRAAAALIGLGLIGLHTGIFFIMHLPFPYFISVDAIFLVNLPFWLMALFAGRKGAPETLT